MTKYCRRCEEKIVVERQPSPVRYQYVAIQPVYCGMRSKHGTTMDGEIMYFHNMCFNMSVLQGKPRYETPGCIPT